MRRKLILLATMLMTSITAVTLLLIGLGGRPAHAAPDPAAPQLLLTEIVVNPTPREFIEIYNPTDQLITLTNVYLTDATDASRDYYYYNIVTGDGAGGAGFGGSDFHARFPATAVIGPGEYQTIALKGSVSFSTTYDILPTYELSDDSAPDLVLDMVEALTDSIGSQAGLTDSGEVVILYYWDGNSDLVTDLDYVLWGAKKEAVDKTGVSKDGPDSDTTPSNYLADTITPTQAILGSGSTPHASGTSVQRKDLSEGAELKTGGNGAGGHDETSENLGQTWCQAAPSPNAATNCRDTPTIRKQGPSLVAAGERFTYTITLDNNLGFSLSNLVITDVVPNNVTFAGSAGGGLGPDNIISWTVLSLANGGSLSRTFAVTASQSLTATINADYAVTATNFLTPTTGDPVVTLVLPSDRTTIHQIQGATHTSPFDGQLVRGVYGIVTVVHPAGGFYLQDPNPDADEATSEGIFVSGSGAQAGDEIFVSGVVNELGSGNELSLTQIATSTVVISSSGHALPPATIIGGGGRVPPQQIIDDDGLASFDQAADGLDFYESLEGMLVQLNDARVVGPTGDSGELVVIADDDGANTGPFTGRGGLFIQPQDFNPERVIVADTIFSTAPKVNVNDRFTAPVTGVLDYSSGNFKLLNPAALPEPISGGLAVETTTPVSAALQADLLTVATFNVSNLGPNDPPARFAGLADQIIHHLGAPDIIALQAIQDNSGLSHDGVVSASETYQTLIEAMTAISGSLAYEFREIAPENLQDGGPAGANLRVGFLFRPDRVDFVDRGQATATTATTPALGAGGVELSLSPGRIDPTHSAFNDTSKSLAGEFLFNGHKIFEYFPLDVGS